MNGWCWIASLLGAGYFPKAPGTVGSLLSVPLWWWLLETKGWYLAALFLVAIVGAYAAKRAGLVWQSSDDSRIVIDEMLGTGIACWGLSREIGFIALAFVFFRFFDIVKPWPAAYFDRKHGGVAVMMDDAVAGLYAGLAVHIVKWIV